MLSRLIAACQENGGEKYVFYRKKCVFLKKSSFFSKIRLSYPEFIKFGGKAGFLRVFPGAWFRTNRVLDQVHAQKEN
jgi:hypothetical protein